MARLNQPVVHHPVEKRGRCLLKRQWLLLLLPLSLTLSLWGKGHPDWVEKQYSQKIYPILSQCVSSVTGLVPFSLAEVFILLLAAIGVWLVARLIKRLRNQSYKNLEAVIRFLSTIGAIVAVICILFVLNCGLNYSRYSFTYYTDLTVRPSSPQELAELCGELIEQVNALRPALSENEDGVMALTASSFGTAQKAKLAFDVLSQDYEVLAGRYAQPKPVFFSRLMSYTQITGFFFPFTFEANVNTAAPDHTIPVTMCHELAHLRGFMREDEANFIGYLACMASDDPEFQYSGAMLALLHCMNSLYAADYEMFCQLSGAYDAGVSRDFTYNNWYWQQFEGTVAEVSDKINDTYLKVNHQTDGVQSYGRMVDLLLADYRARHGSD